MAYSAVCLVCVAVINFAALTHAQVRNKKALKSQYNSSQLAMIPKKENILYQLFVVNSIALYFGWTLVAANLQVGIFLQEHLAKKQIPDFNIKYKVAFVILLSTIVCASVYLFFDVACLQFTSFTLLAYVAILVGLIGIYFNEQPETAAEYNQLVDPSVQYTEYTNNDEHSAQDDIFQPEF